MHDPIERTSLFLTHRQRDELSLLLDDSALAWDVQVEHSAHNTYRAHLPHPHRLSSGQRALWSLLTALVDGGSLPTGLLGRVETEADADQWALVQRQLAALGMAVAA